jgi:hypothetical protein
MLNTKRGEHVTVTRTLSRVVDRVEAYIFNNQNTSEMRAEIVTRIDLFCAVVVGPEIVRGGRPDSCLLTQTLRQCRNSRGRVRCVARATADRSGDSLNARARSHSCASHPHRPHRPHRRHGPCRRATTPSGGRFAFATSPPPRVSWTLSTSWSRSAGTRPRATPTTSRFFGTFLRSRWLASGDRRRYTRAWPTRWRRSTCRASTSPRTASYRRAHARHAAHRPHRLLTALTASSSPSPPSLPSLPSRPRLTVP